MVNAFLPFGLRRKRARPTGETAQLSDDRRLRAALNDPVAIHIKATSRQTSRYRKRATVSNPAQAAGAANNRRTSEKRRGS
jgi:hypothetical protein